MNQREYRIGPGAASLMLLVVVLSMSVLGMLALMSARSDENLSLRSEEVARQAAQSDGEYLARIEAALDENMTLTDRTVSWEETNDEGRTLACAVEVQPLGAYPRYIRTAHRLVIDEGALDTEELLFEAGYIGEL